MYGAGGAQKKKKKPHNTDLETQIRGRDIVTITAKVLVNLILVLARTCLKKKPRTKYVSTVFIHNFSPRAKKGRENDSKLTSDTVPQSWMLHGHTIELSPSTVATNGRREKRSFISLVGRLVGCRRKEEGREAAGRLLKRVNEEEEERSGELKCRSKKGA